MDSSSLMKLGRLRAQLTRLRGQRQRLRWAAAAAAWLAALLAVLALAMAADWLLGMSRLQRMVLVLACVAALAWLFRRLALPWLKIHESELDLAMLLQRQEQIDSDLVAALQFETPEAPTWGSVELEQAVVDRVAQAQRRIDYDRIVARGGLRRRSLILVAMLVLWALLSWCSPEHVRVFFQRLAMGTRHYPSRTRIEQLSVNDHPIDPTTVGTIVTVAYGQPVRFTAECVGRLPRLGEVQLRGTGRDSGTIVALTPQAGQSRQYAGELARLTESAEYRFVLGDGFSERGRIEVVPLPVAVQQLEVIPPTYAASGAGSRGRLPRGLGQTSVIEGSRVVVRLEAEKPLGAAWLTIGDRRHTLRPDAAQPGSRFAKRWILDSTDSPLAAVLEGVEYTIQVVDRDGLQLEHALAGAIRIEPDQAPRVAAAIVTPYVLPAAKPTIYYRALDDFAIDRVQLVREVEHADGKTTRDEVVLWKAESEKQTVRDREERYVLDLGPLKLVKGDKLRVKVQAVDYRGGRPGQTAASEPLVFQVTDQQGILAMMLESDRLSVEQLKTMIQRQLGIGGAP